MNDKLQEALARLREAEATVTGTRRAIKDVQDANRIALAGLEELLEQEEDDLTEAQASAIEAAVEFAQSMEATT